jgi:methylated-DNA-[protein]-cysteine S-methyltransferase
MRFMKAGIESPVGPLTVIEEAGAITSLDWGKSAADNTPVLDQTIEELSSYFAGELTEFTVPLRPGGTAFQEAFYAELLAIPHGETRTYGDLASNLGVSAQAIGQACGANPIPILIPCHRVLAATNLGGYSGRGGIEAKVALLRLEGAASLLI